jgi:hypothetical protein
MYNLKDTAFNPYRPLYITVGAANVGLNPIPSMLLPLPLRRTTRPRILARRRLIHIAATTWGQAGAPACVCIFALSY